MVNLFWLDILRLAVPGVPLNQGAIDHFRKHFFSEGPQPIPAQTPLTIVVAPDEVGGLAPPLEKLRRASGCEAVLAFIDAAAAAITDDPSSAVAKGWANAALQTPAIFVNFSGAEPEVLKYTIQAKHDWKKVGDAMAPNEGKRGSTIDWSLHPIPLRLPRALLLARVRETLVHFVSTHIL